MANASPMTTNVLSREECRDPYPAFLCTLAGELDGEVGVQVA